MLRLVAIAVVLAAHVANAAPLAGLAYSPSGIATFADLQRGVDDARIKADIAQLKALTDEIRLYTVDHGLDRAIPLAAAAGLKVTVGVFLGRETAVNAAEVKKAVVAIKANAKAVTRVIVGNEPVQHGDRTVEQVIQAMDEVRRAIGPGIPVGTAEIWSVWMNEPKLAAASDFIGAHITPYWDGVDVSGAVPYVRGRIAELRRAYPKKPIFVAETGWPSSGPPYQAAVPSPENQARYVRAFAMDPLSNHDGYIMIEAYDEPWKAAREGDTPLWGLFDSARAPKAAVQSLKDARAP